MIELKQVSKNYNDGSSDLEILKEVDLSLLESGAYCVTGKSGAGKSTLLHLIAGIERVSSGQIVINDQDITKLGEDELAVYRQSNIGLIFQMHHLLPEFTALENVMMPLLIRGDEELEASSFAMELLTEVGLDSRAEHRPSELSGGEQQRIAIARALVTKPSLILADEPTGSLDSETANRIEDLLLQQVEKRQIQMLCATHNREFAAKFKESFQIQEGIVK